MRAVALVLLGVALVAIAALVAVQHIYAPTGFQLEVAKALLNILTVAVVGQAVAFLIALHNETKRKASEADQIRHRALDSLNQAFVATKRVRRRARARSTLVSTSGTTEQRRISRGLYFNSLEQLNDVQLKLEILAKDLETYAGLFKDGLATHASVTSMEEYLNGLINEWEHSSVEFVGTPPSANVREMPRFADLIGYYPATDFRPKFVHCYYAAVEKLRGSLVTTTSKSWKHRPAAPVVRRDVGKASKP